MHVVGGSSSSNDGLLKICIPMRLILRQVKESGIQMFSADVALFASLLDRRL